jgi:hypothetical protein
MDKSNSLSSLYMQGLGSAEYCSTSEFSSNFKNKFSTGVWESCRQKSEVEVLRSTEKSWALQ